MGCIVSVDTNRDNTWVASFGWHFDRVAWAEIWLGASIIAQNIDLTVQLSVFSTHLIEFFVFHRFAGAVAWVFQVVVAPVDRFLKAKGFDKPRTRAAWGALGILGNPLILCGVGSVGPPFDTFGVKPNLR